MDIRAWLNRGWKLDTEIKMLEQAKAEERRRVLSITSSPSNTVVSGTKDPHKYDRLIELESKIDEIIDREIAIKKEILDFISMINDVRYRGLLIARYVRFMTWERIAVQMHYGYRQTLRLHKAALKACEEMWRE